MSRPDFNDTRLIEDFLIENYPNPSNDLIKLLDSLDEKSSIYWIFLNCKSDFIRMQLRRKLNYPKRYNCYDDDDDEVERINMGLEALFGGCFFRWVQAITVPELNQQRFSIHQFQIVMRVMCLSHFFKTCVNQSL